MKRLFTILALGFAMFTFGQSNCVADFTYTIDSTTNTITFQDGSWSYDTLNGQSMPSSLSWNIEGQTFTTSSVNFQYTTLPVVACLHAEFSNGCSADYCDTIDIEQSDPCEGFMAYDGFDVVEQGECDGELTGSVFAGTAPFNYNWSNGANTQTISNLCEGTYSYTVTDANGCVTSSSSYVVVDNDTSNQIIDTISNAAIDSCLDFIPTNVYVSNVILVNNTTLEVEWSFVGSNQQTQTITETYTFGGAYGSYLVSISLDCEESNDSLRSIQTWSDIILINEDTSTGITKIETLNNLKLYPNPVKDILNIEFNSTKNNQANIQIVSYTGKIISNENVNILMGNNSISIATSNLNSGIYFVRINDKIIKFVK